MSGSHRFILCLFYNCFGFFLFLDRHTWILLKYYYLLCFFSFKDINECEIRPSLCLPNGKCLNLDGNYTCNCNQGWTGDNCLTGNIFCSLWFKAHCMGHLSIFMWIKVHRIQNAFTVSEFPNFTIFDQKNYMFKNFFWR